MKVLVAEDEKISRNILTAILKKSGLEVEIATNGEEALNALRSPDAPRLAILDWMMPLMDGVDVCREIRTVDTDLPPYIIILTAKGKKEDILEGFEAGADDFLPKPYNQAELQARLKVGMRMIAMQTKLVQRMQDLEEALENIKTLQGIIPICMNCKKIRDDQGYWHKVEQYISEHSSAEFSHSLCSDCLEKLYPEKK